MDGIMTAEDMRQRFKATEYFTRYELAIAFSNDRCRVTSSQVTRDIQALYGHTLDYKSVPYNVVIELYLVRLFRMKEKAVNDVKQVTADQVLAFIKSFESLDDPMAAKWAFAESVWGGKTHFENVIIGKIKSRRVNNLNPQTVNVNAFAI